MTTHKRDGHTPLDQSLGYDVSILIGDDRRRTAIGLCGGDPNDPRCHDIALRGVPPTFAAAPYTYLAQALRAAGLVR